MLILRIFIFHFQDSIIEITKNIKIRLFYRIFEKKIVNCTLESKQ